MPQVFRSHYNILRGKRFPNTTILRVGIFRENCYEALVGAVHDHSLARWDCNFD